MFIDKYVIYVNHSEYPTTRESNALTVQKTILTDPVINAELFTSPKLTNCKGKIKRNIAIFGQTIESLHFYLYSNHPIVQIISYNIIIQSLNMFCINRHMKVAIFSLIVDRLTTLLSLSKRTHK